MNHTSAGLISNQIELPTTTTLYPFNILFQDNLGKLAPER